MLFEVVFRQRLSRRQVELLRRCPHLIKGQRVPTLSADVVRWILHPFKAGSILTILIGRQNSRRALSFISQPLNPSRWSGTVGVHAGSQPFGTSRSEAIESRVWSQYALPIRRTLRSQCNIRRNTRSLTTPRPSAQLPALAVDDAFLSLDRRQEPVQQCSVGPKARLGR